MHPLRYLKTLNESNRHFRAYEYHHLPSQKSPVTFEEIKGKLEKFVELHDFPLNYSLRAFQRDLSAIRLTFGMEIRGSKRSNTYQIVTEESSSINTHLRESLDLIHTFQLTKDLEEFVFFDVQKFQGDLKTYVN